ncbi:MAG: DUF1761 family protein [Saprospiraceae bacterium]|nr:DUF1761 family protein [Saprospiraceae bacterium]
MNWTKLAITGVIIGIVYFFLGWLVYGILLKDAMTMPEGMRELIEYKPEEMSMGLMLLSCLVWGVFLAFFYMKAGISDWKGAAINGAIIAALMSLSMGAGMAAMYKFASMDNAFTDIVANAFCSALSGAAGGWYLGRGKTA